jgi:hypothetical protein
LFKDILQQRFFFKWLNWLSGPGWIDFFLFLSSTLMGLLPRLKRSTHLVRSEADT